MYFRLNSIFVALVLMFGLVALAEGDEVAKKAAKIETIVVPADGVNKFKVTGRSTLFRLTESVIAGGTIDAPVIEGKAKHIRTSEITTVNAKGTPMVGAVVKEYVFRATAAGKVVIAFRKTLPTEAMPIKVVYEITVE